MNTAVLSIRPKGGMPKDVFVKPVRKEVLKPVALHAGTDKPGKHGKSSGAVSRGAMEKGGKAPHLTDTPQLANAMETKMSFQGNKPATEDLEMKNPARRSSQAPHIPSKFRLAAFIEEVEIGIIAWIEYDQKHTPFEKPFRDHQHNIRVAAVQTQGFDCPVYKQYR